MILAILKRVVPCAAIAAAMATTPAYSQSLGSLLKSFQSSSADALSTIGSIKSIASVLPGQVTAGARAENTDGKVILFRTSWCGYCKKAATYMQSKNIPFIERDIETDTAAKAEYKKLGGPGGVPFMVFGDKTLAGFSEAPFDKNYADYQVALAAAAAKPASPAPSFDASKERTNGLQAGQTLIGKIPGVKVYAQANKSADRLFVLGKGDEVIFMGEERDGLYLVTTQKGEGWVDKLLVKAL